MKMKTVPHLGLMTGTREERDEQDVPKERDNREGQDMEEGRDYTERDVKDPPVQSVMLSPRSVLGPKSPTMGSLRTLSPPPRSLSPIPLSVSPRFALASLPARPLTPRGGGLEGGFGGLGGGLGGGQSLFSQGP